MRHGKIITDKVAIETICKNGFMWFANDDPLVQWLVVEGLCKITVYHGLEPIVKLCPAENVNLFEYLT